MSTKKTDQTLQKCDELIGRLNELKKALNKTQPSVEPKKSYSPEQLAAIKEASNLKKNVANIPWVRHGSIPNADREVKQLQVNNPVHVGENLMANQLAQMMRSKAMMRPDHRQPTSEDMIMAGEAMGIAPSDKMVKNAENDWNNAMNSWLSEAVKPISSRFASEEEEVAYWSSIKVSDRSGGDYGF